MSAKGCVAVVHIEDLLRLATAQARAADEQIQDTWATKDVSVLFCLLPHQKIWVGCDYNIYIYI